MSLSRLVDRAPGPAFFAAAWVVVIACELLVLRPILLDRDTPVVGLEVVFGLVGGSFAAFGLVAWRRRPDSRSGLWMTLTGFGFFVHPLLTQIPGALAFTLWSLLVDVWIFAFVPLLLTLLSRGRMQHSLDRWLVASYAVPLVFLQVIWMLFAEIEGGDNLLLAFPDEDIAHALDMTQRTLTACATGATVVVIAARWWRASAPRRRALLPSLAGAFVLSLFTALLVNDLLPGPRSEILLWCTACSLVTVPAAFLAGLLRSRLARGALAELFRTLGAMRGEALRSALAKALGDPNLTVAYWRPESGSYGDAEGRLVTLPEEGVAPVERGGRPVAALLYDPSLDDDPELVEAVSSAAGIAIENARLLEESEVRLAELKASRERIVAAGDAERRRLERNLHDGAQQRLVGIALQLKLLQNRLRDDPSAEQLVTTVSAELASSLEELRELARGIHPAVLEHGLDAALRSLATRAPVATTVTYDAPGRLPEQVELAGYFVACEALANIAKYAHATGADIRVWQTPSKVHIAIADDGVGGADESEGSGLRGLADRVEALDGRLDVQSPPGGGTTIHAELPCGS